MKYHQISNIAPVPLLRTIKKEYLEEFFEKSDIEYEQIEDEYGDLRHSNHKYRLYIDDEDYIVDFHRDGLMDGGNKIGFSEDIPDEVEWDIVRMIGSTVLAKKGERIDEGYKPDTVKIPNKHDDDDSSVSINSPTGFLVSELDEQTREEYLKKKEQYLKELKKDLENADDIEEWKNAIEKFVVRDDKLSENFLIGDR